MWRRNRNFIRAQRTGRAFFTAVLLSTLAGATSAQDPDRLLQRNCMGCHASGVAGAPRFGDAGDWAARIGTDGWDAMVRRGWEGSGRMPPKGYCVQCSPEDFEVLVRKMIPESVIPQPSLP